MAKWPDNPKRPTVEVAQKLFDNIVSNSSGAYLNIGKRHSAEEQQKAIDLADQLRDIIAGKRDWLD